MNFYCIYGKEEESTKLLKESCKKKNIKFIKLNPDEYDYSKKISFKKGDILYRVSIGKKYSDLEKFLIDEKVTTFYNDYSRSLSSISNILTYEKANIPRPKTIYRLTRNKNLLKKYSEILGFPLIIKAMGGSHGVGIIKVDSLTSLFSISDYLLSNKNRGSFIMKEFINVTSSARLIVLGDKVIDSIEYKAPEGDFRSNEGKIPNVQIKKFPTNIEKIAIQATKALGIEFSGVDILIDNKGNGYIAETNFPCFFPRAQMLTKINISGMMVDYLVNKSKK